MLAQVAIDFFTAPARPGLAVIGAVGFDVQYCLQVADAVELLALIDCLYRLGTLFAECRECVGNAAFGLVL